MSTYAVFMLVGFFARFYGIVSGYQWMAIPLFVFMGVMLEK